MAAIRIPNDTATLVRQSEQESLPFFCFASFLIGIIVLLILIALLFFLLRNWRNKSSEIITYKKNPITKTPLCRVYSSNSPSPAVSFKQSTAYDSRLEREMPLLGTSMLNNLATNPSLCYLQDIHFNSMQNDNQQIHCCMGGRMFEYRYPTYIPARRNTRISFKNYGYNPRYVYDIPLQNFCSNSSKNESMSTLEWDDFQLPEHSTCGNDRVHLHHEHWL